MKLILQAINALFRKIEASRTHWEAVEEVEVVAETTVTISEDVDCESLPDISHRLTVGQTYFVTLNGVPYKCVAWQSTESSDAVMIGNGSIYGGDGGNDEPFSCDSYSDCSIELNVATAGTYTISISTMENAIHKLDKKYIPDDLLDSIAEAKTAADNAQTAADNAQTAADNAQTAADNAKTKADNAYTATIGVVKLVNVTIPKSMTSELVTLLNELQTGERGKVSYDGNMFSTYFSIGCNVQAEFDYAVGAGTYYEYMLLNSTTGYDAQGFLYWNYSHTGTDTKIYFIKLGNKVNVSYIEAIRLA